MQKTDEPADEAVTAEPERAVAAGPGEAAARPSTPAGTTEASAGTTDGPAGGDDAPTDVPPDASADQHWPRHWPLLLLGAAVVPGLALFAAGRWMEDPAVQAWRTVCLSIAVQALPFLLLGTALSGAINAFVPARVFTRLLPRRPALAVPVAGAAGVILPGCECASVPVAQSLIRRGVDPAAAFAFLLSAPAVNPIVLTATAIAFPGSPAMVLARLLASLATAAAMGWLWLWLGRAEWLKPIARHSGHRPGQSRWNEFRTGFQHDFLHAGGFLVVGAMAAATFNVLVPRTVLDAFADSPWLSVLFLAALAILLSVCSEADAFVAASLTGFSPTARLTFMVVGPMVDLKLIALQTGTFGRAFAVRFSAATVVVAILCSVLIGAVLL
ncbi:permease [Streptomyces sp. NPDC057438]|uniref:permease n=1 Tax=Streptomyces sp. NPDC057438 TaxID=3346133 RepID=UPI00368E4BD9